MILLLIVVVLLLLLLGLWGYNRGRWRRWGSPGPASRRPVRPCPANTHVAAPGWGRGWGHPRSPVPSGPSRDRKRVEAAQGKPASEEAAW